MRGYIFVSHNNLPVHTHNVYTVHPHIAPSGHMRVYLSFLFVFYYSLQELDASRNQLAFIPSSLFQMNDLIYLNLSYNLLRCLPGDMDDACPDAEWTCEKVKRFDLSHNRIRTLPERFDNLRRLNTLNVAYNYLQELPVSLSWGCINLVST